MEEAEESKMTVFILRLKCPGTNKASQPTKEGGKQVMFEIKEAIIYHPWHILPTQSGQLLHIESNNEKNVTLFSPPPPKFREPMPTSAGSHGETVKTGAEMS